MLMYNTQRRRTCDQHKRVDALVLFTSPRPSTAPINKRGDASVRRIQDIIPLDKIPLITADDNALSHPGGDSVLPVSVSKGTLSEGDFVWGILSRRIMSGWDFVRFQVRHTVHLLWIFCTTNRQQIEVVEFGIYSAT